MVRTKPTSFDKSDLSPKKHWQSSEKQDWLTPPEYLDRVYRFGRVALDPCGSRNAILVADRFIYPDVEDGLKADWRRLAKGGLVFMNSEYGEALRPWVQCAHAWGTRGVEIIALVPAYPGADWFDWIWQGASGVHFWEQRLAFLDSNRIPQSGAPMYSATAYWGSRPKEFARAFADAGRTMFNWGRGGIE